MSIGFTSTQGTREDGREFGYLDGDGGGWFFTHMDSADETIASLEVDSDAGDGGITRDEAEEFLRDKISE